MQSDGITKKTDVWSLGIMILEILTGKLPTNSLHYVQGSEEDDLAAWVWSKMEAGDVILSDTLDKEMKATSGSENEIAGSAKLLRVALACCEADVEKRLDMREAAERIEEVRERDGDDEFYSMRWSRGLADEIVIQEKE